MATWTYEQLVNGLTNGDINGQDSWSSPEGKLNVGTSNPYEGTKAIAITNDTTPYGATRSLPASVTGATALYFAMRLDNKTAFSAGGAMAIRLIDTGSGARFHIVFNSADIGIGNGGDTIAETIVSGYTQAQYYVIHVDFDLDNNRIRARAHNGTSWGSYTAYVTNASINSIETIGVYGGTVSGSGTGYLDTITPTNPISTSVTVTPSALSVTSALQASTRLIAQLPSALSIAATLQTPSLFAGTIFSATALTISSTLQTSVPSVAVLPSALSISSTLQTPTYFAGVILTPSALSISSTLQTPIPLVAVLPSTLTVTHTVQSVTTLVSTLIQPEAISITATLRSPNAFWTDRTSPTTSWVDRTSPSSSWTDRTSPSTTWADVV